MLTNKQQQILDAARKIFTEKGYYGTTMNAIAEAVGIRKATLYSHFNHKEALFHYLFEDIISVHSDALNEIFKSIETYSVKRQLYEFMKRYIDYCYNNERVELWNHFYYYPPESMKDYVRASTHKAEGRIREQMMKQIIRGQVDGQIKPIDADIVYQLYYNMYLGFVLSAPEYESKDMHNIIKSTYQLYWEGVKN